MDLLKQSTGQAREAFAAMPMQSRVISIMLVAAIVIALAFLMRGSQLSGKDLLFGGRLLTEQELDGIELAFSQAGLNSWKREGRRIEIPADSKSLYLNALAEKSSSLPGSLQDPIQEALDATNVFEPTGMRESREMLAKQQALSIRIAAFPDVQSAWVTYDKGERRGFSQSPPQSASVVVTPEGTMPLSRSRIRDIQNLVRGSYAGLASEDIVVTDTISPPGGSLADEDDPLLRKQREVEAWVQQKVRNVLVGFPAQVEVSAELDPTMDQQSVSVKFDAEPSILSNKTMKKEFTNNQQPARGVPGTATNAIGNRALSLDEATETSKTKEDTRETTGIAGQQYENSRMASFQVKTIRVSVGLPTSYYEKLHVHNYLKKNIDKTAADATPMTDVDLENLRSKTKKDIQTAVTPLLPDVAAGADRFPLVEVFDYTDFPEPEPVPPATAKLALTWLGESWQTLALVGLAIVALLVARSAARSGSESTPPAFTEGFGLDLPAPPPESDVADEDRERMTITGKSLRDELLTLVEDNPEVAANVIRGWVGEAA